MTTEKQHPLARGYEVVPYNNGGWTVHERAEADQWAVPLGAFTNWTDLIDWLAGKHGEYGYDKSTREAKERVDKLKLEEQSDGAVLNRAGRQTAFLAKAGESYNAIAPVGHYRLRAWLIKDQRPLCEDFADFEEARRRALAVIGDSTLAVITNDQGEIVNELRPAAS